MIGVVKVAYQVIATVEWYCSHLYLVVTHFELGNINLGLDKSTIIVIFNDLNVISTLHMVILTQNMAGCINCWKQNKCHFNTVKLSYSKDKMTGVVTVAYKVIVTVEWYCSHLCLILVHLVFSDINIGLTN